MPGNFSFIYCILRGNNFHPETQVVEWLTLSIQIRIQPLLNLYCTFTEPLLITEWIRNYFPGCTGSTKVRALCRKLPGQGSKLSHTCVCSVGPFLVDLAVCPKWVQRQIWTKILYSSTISCRIMLSFLNISICTRAYTWRHLLMFTTSLIWPCICNKSCWHPVRLFVSTVSFKSLVFVVIMSNAWSINSTV